MKTLHYVGVYITVKVKSSLRCQPWPFFFLSSQLLHHFSLKWTQLPHQASSAQQDR